MHNDLKLENIMVGDGDGQNKHEIRLIDFGLATAHDMRAIDLSYFKHYKGNPAFSSSNSMKGGERSQKDDLIMLAYMLVYLSQGFLPYL